MVVKPPRTKQMKHSIPRGQRDIGSSDDKSQHVLVKYVPRFFRRIKDTICWSAVEQNKNTT